MGTWVLTFRNWYKPCVQIGEFPYLDDDTIRRWYKKYQKSENEKKGAYNQAPPYPKLFCATKN